MQFRHLALSLLLAIAASVGAHAAQTADPMLTSTPAVPMRAIAANGVTGPVPALAMSEGSTQVVTFNIVDTDTAILNPDPPTDVFRIGGFPATFPTAFAYVGPTDSSDAVTGVSVDIARSTCKQGAVMGAACTVVADITTDSSDWWWETPRDWGWNWVTVGISLQYPNTTIDYYVSTDTRLYVRVNDPEPAGWLVLVPALAALGVFRRQKQQPGCAA